MLLLKVICRENHFHCQIEASKMYFIEWKRCKIPLKIIKEDYKMITVTAARVFSCFTVEWKYNRDMLSARRWRKIFPLFWLCLRKLFWRSSMRKGKKIQTLKWFFLWTEKKGWVSWRGENGKDFEDESRSELVILTSCQLKTSNHDFKLFVFHKIAWLFFENRLFKAFLYRHLPSFPPFFFISTPPSPSPISKIQITFIMEFLLLKASQKFIFSIVENWKLSSEKRSVEKLFRWKFRTKSYKSLKAKKARKVLSW